MNARETIATSPATARAILTLLACVMMAQGCVTQDADPFGQERLIDEERITSETRMTRDELVVYGEHCESLETASRSYGPATDDMRERFQEAIDQISRGEYEEGAARMEQLYEDYPNPILLYNAARAHELGGDEERAVRAYYTIIQGGGLTRGVCSQIARRLIEIHDRQNPPAQKEGDEPLEEDEERRHDPRPRLR